MQTKTIEKKLKSKLNNWLKTIIDADLRKEVKENLLVSGGSITSMLLNEPVNDYDIYIKDMDILMRLTKYYTKNISGVQVLDGRKRVDLCEDIEGDNAFAISVRNLKENQIKIYFSDSEKGGKRLNKEKKEDGFNYNLIFLSPNAISLSNDIQIVIRFHGDNEQIHKTFDFMHATNYFTFEAGLVTNITALESILTKQLRYQGSLYPLTSIIRMKKFIKRGWNISAGEILKIMFQISELDLKNPDVLEEQLIGVDVAYFGTLIGILRGADRSKITSAYLNSIIDKVFNSSEEVQ